ncbi:NAD-dependent formate dehydrogenase, alpha subunit, selenocysteine-containing [Carboxydothermus pertinax]|uniref:NAD-dependent formate dehydrogenase, alpha subunit, selenocysteine-containing n=2 Tax=Carboxydothermus pertinax TaxID=870242 RepID=A0A1L8CSR8_9THEO|nr:NAD-dependent formate dehydrogenase, alpha subunit, selenocysteine-containing [Carboxydothermus pertinax]
MADITLKINGIKVTVPEGTTILEAAQTAGFKIPTLCHDPELSKPGACRICVVEVKGARNLAASCVTPVAPGMEVLTHSEPVINARKEILDLLLSNHPEDCLTCDKMGECALAAYAYEYGVRRGSYQGDKNVYPIEDNNPFIVRDMNKCILCGKCVRVCDEIVGYSVIDFINRGFKTKVAPPYDGTLAESNCVFCGSCVTVCPTGALTVKDTRGKFRPWEVKRVKTTCPYCGVGCNFDLLVKDDKVVGVAPNPTSEVNGRFMCVKGRFGYKFIHSGDRLTKPLIKKNGEFVEATWDEALELVAEKLAEVKAKHGSDAIGILASAKCTNEDNYLLSKFARAVIGTNNIDHCARL